MVTSIVPAFAIKNVSFTVDNNTATVEAEDVERFAVAQYDNAGALKAFGISSLMGEKQTATMSYTKDLDTRIYTFTDWNTLTSEEEGLKIGQKTLVYADFEGGRESTFLVNDLGYEIDSKFETTDRDDNATNALLMRGTTNGTPFNIQFGGAESEKSDFVVYEYDLMLNSVDTKFISYIKAVKPDGAAGGWQTLWKVNPDDEDNATIDFGAGAINGQSIVADTWYRVSAAVDYHNSTIKYYMDNVLMGEEEIVPEIHPDVNSPDIFYIHGPSEGGTDFVVDNVRVYEGTHTRDSIGEYKGNIDLTKPTIVERDETDEREALAGKYVLHIRSGVAIDRDGNKTLMAHKPYIKDGKIYVHRNSLEKAWKVSYSNVGTDEKGYVSLTDMAPSTGLNLYTPEAEINSGLVVLADLFDEPDDLQSLNNYAFYLRASDEDVLKAYNKSATKNVHPRLFATQSDFDRMRDMYEAGTDEAFMAWAEDVIEYADSRIDKDPPEFSEMSSSGRTLQRKLKGDVYAWAMAYHLTGDEKYVERTVEELTYFCNFRTWYPQDHLHIIETMDAFAVAYDWLYNVLSNNERKLFEENMYDKGFIPSYQAFRNEASAMGNAFYASNNHGTVCNGGMAMAALAFMDVYPEECAWFVSNTMKGMEFNIDKWNTGAWYEGAGYWEYAAAYTVKFIEGLRSVLGTDFGFASLEGLDITAEQEIGMHGNLGIYNYADAGLGKYYSPEMLWLGSEFNNHAVATKVAKEYNGSFPQNHRRLGESITLALLWYNPEMIDETATFPNDYFYEDLDVITMREGWNNTDTFVGVKAGVLNEAHSQLDSGSFIFESDGIRWLQDMGAGSYENGYFDSAAGGRRWQFIQNRAEGHNTVTVNPGDVEDMNVANKGATADMTLVESNDKGAIVTVNMEEVLYNVNHATRGFFFTDNRESLVVRDEITVAKLPVSENFDGRTSTNIFGTYESNYELVSGASYGLDANDTVAKLTGNNRYFNNNPWNANSGTQDVTFEFDFYAEDSETIFQFYPVGSNRYGMQIGNGAVYALLPNWETEATGRTLTPREWHHFKVEYDMANGQMLIYMGTTLIHTQTGLNNAALAPIDHYFNLTKDVNGKGVLIDNVECYTKTPVERNDVIYWHLIPDNDAIVTVDADTNTITMTKGGKICYIEYAVEGGTIAEEKFEKPIVSVIENAKPIADKYGRIVLKITNITSDVSITAKITPESATSVTPLSDYTKAISTWELN